MLSRPRLLLLVLAGWIVCFGCKKEELPAVHVGSKSFTEQLILGEIIAQHLDSRMTGARVVRNLGLVGTQAAHQALLSGEIDLYPEYSGAALTTILKLPASSDLEAVREQVRQNYSYRFQMDWLPPLGFENGFIAAVRGEDARAGKIRSLSDAARRKEGWVIGSGHEFLTSPDGYSQLMKNYQLPLKPPIQTLDQTLLYTALTERQVEMVFGNATDGMLNAKDKDILVLDDDKSVFPPYEAAIVVRRDALARFPQLGPALYELSRRFTSAQMRKLNYEVDVLHRKPADVAAEALRDIGLGRGAAK